MDSRTLIGKTLFFLALIAFVTVFSYVFGEDNSLIGLVIVIVALMMLGKDLSIEPTHSFVKLTAMFVCMAIAAHLSLVDPFLGIVVNLATVSAVVLLTVGDLTTPIHFPFMLGYVFMLSSPVSTDGLAIRLLALVIGSVMVVGLNILVHRRHHVSHEVLASICDDVRSCAEKVCQGEVPDGTSFDIRCRDAVDRLRDRIREASFVRGSDRLPLDVASSLREIGRYVCSCDDHDGCRHVMDIMEAIASHERGEILMDDVRRKVDPIMVRGPFHDKGLRMRLTCLLDDLESLEGGRGGHMAPLRFREAFRRDSVGSNFAVRMALLFSMVAFAWQYWDKENSVWLLYTIVALVQPYVDGAWDKSVDRVVGTVIGTVLFVTVMVFVNDDAVLMGVALLLINYVYMVLDPKDYHVSMVFITASALMMASMSVPAEDAMVERVAYILIGVAAALVANYVVLPYRMDDENLELGRRYVDINRRRVQTLGMGDDDTLLMLEAEAVSRKLRVNNDVLKDQSLEGFIDAQDRISSECGVLHRMMKLDDPGEDVRKQVDDLSAKVDESMIQLGRMALRM